MTSVKITGPDEMMALAESVHDTVLDKAIAMRVPGLFATLIEENVLHHRIGDTEVMAGQLGQLLSSMTLPSMSLGIIPAQVPREQIMWPLEQFTVFDDVRVNVDLLAAKATVTDRANWTSTCARSPDSPSSPSTAPTPAP
ncbi:Scr1 family TA system antitoxin-like transcriptional regulator [Streptomyces siamensis]|uniref:DUF5753 domain-containing protein n=1 Tax=Streptomyces siamensis TaxID=1274986 RepID=A0ABP9JGI6_9ACTN